MSTIAERNPIPAVGRLVRLIDWYQRGTEGRPSPCRFTPSCSTYAREALEAYGARYGLWLTVRRLLRCRPFGPSGFDPVPEGRVSPHRHPHPAESDHADVHGQKDGCP